MGYQNLIIVFKKCNWLRYGGCLKYRSSGLWCLCAGVDVRRTERQSGVWFRRWCYCCCYWRWCYRAPRAVDSVKFWVCKGFRKIVHEIVNVDELLNGGLLLCAWMSANTRWQATPTWRRRRHLFLFSPASNIRVSMCVTLLLISTILVMYTLNVRVFANCCEICWIIGVCGASSINTKQLWYSISDSHNAISFLWFVGDVEIS